MRISEELRPSQRPARALAQFVLSGLVAVALLGLAAVEVMRRSGTDEAVRDAKQTTRLAAYGIVAPTITPALLQHNPQAIKKMDERVRRSILGRQVVRLKIWNAKGQIVYSDEHRLIGHTYGLGREEREALEHQSADAELSNLSEPENRYERDQKKLLEVYQGVRSPAGEPLLVEAYNKFSSVSASGRRLWLVFAPAMIGALLLLQAAQIPLAWSLLRRLQRGQYEREMLLQRALDAAETERSRIARDLHDGTVQDLAGVSFTLAAAADKLDRRGELEAAELIDQAADDTRRSVRELRTLLVDLYPPTLHQQGLAAALTDLLAPLSARGMQTNLVADAELSVPEDAERKVFRAAQEAYAVGQIDFLTFERAALDLDTYQAEIAARTSGIGRALAALQKASGLPLIEGTPMPGETHEK